MIIICNTIRLPTINQVNAMNLQSDSGRGLPPRLDALNETEQLVLRGLRRWVAGFADSNPDHWRIVWTEFAGRMGPRTGREALGGLEALVRAIWSHARQPIRCHRPCCGFVEADEHRILAFVATCQAGDWPAARRLAESLIAADGTGDMLQAGSRLGQALLMAHRCLPQRCPGGAEDRATPLPVQAESTLIH